MRYEALTAQNEVSSMQHVQKEVEEVKLQCRRMKVTCNLIGSLDAKNLFLFIQTDSIFAGRQ